MGGLLPEDDFNGDGRDDLVYWAANGQVNTLGSNANGSLGSYQHLIGIPYPRIGVNGQGFGMTRPINGDGWPWPTSGSPKPDLRIRKAASSSYKGDNVYNTTGAGQISSARVGPRQTAAYLVSVQNDSPLHDRFQLRGTASTSNFLVTYRSAGQDLTATVTGGGYTTGIIEPGATMTLRVAVTGRSSARAGAAFSGTLRVASLYDSTRRDKVGIVTRVQ